MIEFRTGDILQEDVEALVNTVNCVGIMGRGIALQFKNAFPENFKAYAAACRRDEVKPGSMYVFETNSLTNPKYIINFPTKRHWRGKSRIEDIDAGLTSLVEEIRRREIQSIAVPPLGSGLGGLDWSVVKRRIEDRLQELENVKVVVFEPRGAPEVSKMVRSKNAPAMTLGRAALIGLIHRYLGGLLDPFVTLLEVHKLMYFMQVAGEPLRLQFQKAPYGPYAENLRHVLRAVEGYYVSGYADGGDAPGKQLNLVPGAIQEADDFLTANFESRARFQRVADLVDGFESPFGLELLSTVLWLAREKPQLAEDDIVEETYAWGERKRRFTPLQIKLAFGILSEKGWLSSSR